MWYVMQVRTGTEESICSQCRRIIDKRILERCFVPYYEEKKRFHGKWHIQEKILFPGYVFLIVNDLNRLLYELHTVIGLTKVLGTGDDIVPLTKEEEQFLLRIGRDEQKVEMSIGIIENDQVKIQEGPLVGLEGSIRKIDRHKRRAWLEVEMFGRVVEMQVGLEIVEKK